MPVTRRSKAKPSFLLSATKASAAKVNANFNTKGQGGSAAPVGVKPNKSLALPVTVVDTATAYIGIGRATGSEAVAPGARTDAHSIPPTNVDPLIGNDDDARPTFTTSEECSAETTSQAAIPPAAVAEASSTMIASFDSPVGTKLTAGNDPDASSTPVDDSTASATAASTKDAATAAVNASSAASTANVSSPTAGAKVNIKASDVDANALATAAVIRSSTASTANASSLTAGSKAYVKATDIATIASSTTVVMATPTAIAADAPTSDPTDALAAEALDATEGAFPSVADAIEAANSGNGIGLAVNSCDEGGAPGLGYDSGTVTPSGFDSYVSTVDSTGRKPGFQTASKAPLSMHIQAPGTTKPSTVTPSGIDSNASFSADSTANQAGLASSGGEPGVHSPALESGSRAAAVSTLCREPHPFLTTENANAYAQDPRMEGLTIDIDDEYPSEIQRLPWNVFLTPRERGASLQDEYLAARYAAKQLRDGELIRRVCDDWNYNAANSYTPTDLRQGPIMVRPQGRLPPP